MITINSAALLSQNSEKPSRKLSQRDLFSREISLPAMRGQSQIRIKHGFFSELSVLLSAGMDLRSSFEIIISGLIKESQKVFYDGIFSSILKGDSLADSLKKSDVFTVYDCYSVRIGEESGTLARVISELAEFYAKRIWQRKQVLSALTYPILVLCTTILSMYFMLSFVVPMFEDVFLRFSGELPAITRFVINLSDSFPLFLAFLILSLLFSGGLCWYYRNEEWYRKYTSILLMRLPVLGKVTALVYRVRFCQTLKLLLGSGVHLLESVALVREMIGFYPYEKALEKIHSDLSEGRSLAEAMEPFIIFDRRLIALTRVAEEVNKLEMMYDQLYQVYTAELDNRIKTMNSLLEPVLIIFVGGLVAFILISMYLPIFQIGIGLS
jgi:type IV pilus assembly protein PilC